MWRAQHDESSTGASEARAAPPIGGGAVVVREGVLTKLGGETPTWHARWVRIVKGGLLLYKSETAPAVRGSSWTGPWMWLLLMLCA
jgi:hypothetical protein